MMDKFAWRKDHIEEWGEISADTDIVCPYCFFKQEDLFEIHGAYDDGEHDYKCQHCGQEFIFETCTSIDYTSRRKEDD